MSEGVTWPAEDIVKGTIVCRACAATYDVIWGTPFLGHYEAGDILSLIEIAANARADNACVGAHDIARIEGLLHRYHHAADKDAFTAQCSDSYARAPWFQHRYTEYAAFLDLTGGIEFAGRDILDVGAGSGYDAWRLIQAGGRVTAVEYNPMLVRRGRSVVPEARWFGGFSHALPFASERFDIVCCNAALHHMRDIPTAMHEMLRVLRPGGWLLTTGDPFCADHSSDDHEFDIFDRHADVLLGVNESIPRFGSLIETLSQHKERLEIGFLSSTLYGMWASALQPRANIFENRRWSFDAADRLAAAAGSISIKVRTNGPLRLDVRNQDGLALRAGDYASVLGDYDAAVVKLVGLLPAGFVDRAFPGDRQTKFELLNGWQKPQSNTDYRTGYRRARWYLSVPKDASALCFQVKRLQGKTNGSASLEVCIDGTARATVDMSGAWVETSVPLAGLPPRARFVCELRLASAEIAEAQFEDHVFAVRHRRFA